MALITSSTQNVDLIKLKTEIETYSYGTENIKFLVRGSQTNSNTLELDIVLASSGSPDLTLNQITALNTLVTNHQNNQRKRIIVADAPDANDAATNKSFVQQQVNQAVSDLIGSAPEVLNTLGEIAEIMAKDPVTGEYPNNIVPSILSRLDVIENQPFVEALDNLSDVIIDSVSLANNDVLTYNSGTNTWINKSSFSGSYIDLTNKPTLFSGSYNDLTDTPNLPFNEYVAKAGDDMTGQLNILTPTSNDSHLYKGLHIKGGMSIGANDPYDGSFPSFHFLVVNPSYNDISLQPMFLVQSPQDSETKCYITPRLISLSAPNQLSPYGAPIIDVSWTTSGGVEHTAIIPGTIYGLKDPLTDDEAANKKYVDTAVSSKVDSSSLAAVATSGSYNDLTDTPNLATVATTGLYDDLINKPTILTLDQVVSGQHNNVTGEVELYIPKFDGTTTPPTAMGLLETVNLSLAGRSGNYNDLSNLPSLFSGSYNDLSDKPTLVAALDDLSDVTITSAANGEILQYNGTAWINSTIPTSSVNSLTDLSDVTISTPIKGNILVHNGTNFVNSNYIEVGNPDLAPLTLKGAFQQNANLLNLQTFDDNTVFSVNIDGTILVGSWAGSVIDIDYGGTGATSQQAALNNITNSSAGSTGHVLTRNSAGSAVWQAITTTTFALPDGSAGSPALYFINDTNTGFYRQSSDKLTFVANGQNALVVDGTSGVGRLMVGNGTPISRIQLADDNNDTASGITLGANSSTSVKIYKSASNILTATGKVLVNSSTDNGAYNLQCNGTGVWGAGAYVNGSDERIKENVTSLENTLTLINKLNPVTFNYKKEWSNDQSIQPGFIAQEVAEALSNTAYVDGIVQDGGQYLSMAYQNLIPLLVKSIQELTEKIETLENKIKILENN